MSKHVPSRLAAKVTWRWIFIFSSIPLLLSACSGEVSGTVYVTMRSGDVKRGADLEVGLIQDHVMSELTKASVDFKASYGQAESAYQDATSGASAGNDEGLARVREAQGRVDAVRKEWLDRAAKLVRTAAVKVTRTDVNGHYEFKGVSRGKYYIMASHRVFDNDLFWLVPVEVHGAQTVDLSNSNTRSALDLIRDEGGTAKAASVPVSKPILQEKPHQPKWLVEQLAKEQREARERQESPGARRRETEGTWRLLQTIFKRPVNNGWTPESVLSDVLKNSEQFQSQAVVASSLSKEECRRVANETANAIRAWGDRRSDAEDGIVLIRRGEREAADTSGWTRNPRVEESVTVWVWNCGDASSEGKTRRSAAVPAAPSAAEPQR